MVLNCKKDINSVPFASSPSCICWQKQSKSTTIYSKYFHIGTSLTEISVIVVPRDGGVSHHLTSNYLSIRTGQERRTEMKGINTNTSNTAVQRPCLSHLSLPPPLSTSLDFPGCFVMKLSQTRVPLSPSCLKREERRRERQNHREEDAAKTTAREKNGVRSKGCEE